MILGHYSYETALLAVVTKLCGTARQVDRIVYGLIPIRIRRHEGGQCRAARYEQPEIETGTKPVSWAQLFFERTLDHGGLRPPGAVRSSPKYLSLR